VIIIGELINSTRSEVKKAVKEKDEAYIRKLVKIQVKGGASYLDVNAAMGFKKEKEDLKWLLQVIQDETSLPLAIDTPDPEVMEEGVKWCKAPPLINSITNEEKKEKLIKIARQYNTGVIALPLGLKKGIPKTSDERIEEAGVLIRELETCGIERERIFLDALVMSIGSDQDAGRVAMDTVRKYKSEFPGIKTIGGLTNVSYGLPERRLLNRAFLAMMIGAGLDAAIMDPTDRESRGIMLAAEALAGKDRYCLEYMKSVR